MTKLAIFSVDIRITGAGEGARTVRGSVNLRAREYLERMKRRPPPRSLAQFIEAAEAGLRPREVELLHRLRPEAPPAPAPLPMPHSRREVFEQREASQRGMQQNLRNALALDTIEAFYDDKSDGPIRRLKGTGNPEFAPCPACGVSRALPMDQADAAYVLQAFRRARMPAAMAYAFATTRVIVTQKNRHRLCGCDVVAWDSAIAFFKRTGRVAWRRFGLDP